MIVILKKETSKKDVDALISWAEGFHLSINPIFGSHTTVLGFVGDTSVIDMDAVLSMPCVERVMKVQEPYKRANRKFHPGDTVVDVCGVRFGGGGPIPIIAGPCSVESEEQITLLGKRVQAAGASMLRGGAFKPRTSPYAFQGLGTDGLTLLKAARGKTGLPIVSEITNPGNLEAFAEHVDLIQVGARSMQNFELLKALGRLQKPVLLKRGFSNTVEELLMSAEYILSGGNGDVILCERGIRTFETQTRNTLDISAVPVLKRLTHLPVVVDPSHASGMAALVEPLALAAVAAGADGLIIEVHQDPKNALSDGPQSVTPDEFAGMMPRLRAVARAVGRKL